MLPKIVTLVILAFGVAYYVDHNRPAPLPPATVTIDSSEDLHKIQTQIEEVRKELTAAKECMVTNNLYQQDMLVRIYKATHENNRIRSQETSGQGSVNQVPNNYYEAPTQKRRH